MKHFISFCTFLLFSTLLFAQAERSLDECIRIAWKQNPSLRNSGIDIKEARMDYISSVASFLPRVSVSAEAGRNFGRSIDPNTNGYTNDTFDEGTVGLDMTLSLFEGFTRINRVRFEKMNRNRSEWALKERRNELACQVTDAYYKLLLEERMLDLALEQSRLSERYLKQTEAFVELGLKSVSDLQEVKARREGDIYRYQARQNGCRLALLRLKQLLNLHAEDTLAVQDTINYELLSAYPLPQTEELYTQSLVAMPSMRMMELRQRAARKEYAMAGGKFFANRLCPLFNGFPLPRWFFYQTVERQFRQVYRYRYFHPSAERAGTTDYPAQTQVEYIPPPERGRTAKATTLYGGGANGSFSPFRL